MPRISINSVILDDGSTMILPPAVRLFSRPDAYVLCHGRARNIRMARVGLYPDRHEVARALLTLDYERSDENRGYATASAPPAAAAF